MQGDLRLENERLVHENAQLRKEVKAHEGGGGGDGRRRRRRRRRLMLFLVRMKR